jgi:Protein of unknown function (DUF2971)
MVATQDEQTRWLAAHVHKQLEDDGADRSWFFVVCMSEERDDLSQWRAYGSGEGGVAIQFETRGLIPIGTQNKVGLVAVCYDENRQKRLAEDITAATIQFFKAGLAARPGADQEKWAESFLTHWREKVIWFAPMLKHQAFRKEVEWRMLCSLGPEDRKYLRVKQRPSLLSRHLPLRFGERLPITEVMVGPCRHANVSLVSVERTFKERATR